MSATTTLAGVVDEAAIDSGGPDGRWSSLGAAPEAVVSPSHADEAASVLRWATAEGVGVVCAGSGRRLGPRRMTHRFIVLTTDRLTSVEWYEPADLTVTAGAGTTVARLDAKLRPHGQWLPFDPPDVMDRTLGGLVAAGRSGPLRTGYGELRNHVLGATVVTGDGRILRLGGRVVKNVAGFDLLKPLVGSLGRLAFITSVSVRTFPVPSTDRRLVVTAARLGELVFPALAVATAPVLPVSCVLLRDADGARLAVRLHGARTTVDADQRTLERHTGLSFEVIDGETGSEAAARERAGPPGTVQRRGAVGPGAAPGPWVLAMSALPTRLSEVVAAVETQGPEWVHVDAYGARLRAAFLDFDVARAVALREVAESVGGALEVEATPADGDGAAIGSALSPAERALEVRVRRAFDPSGVLWRS